MLGSNGFEPGRRAEDAAYTVRSGYDNEDITEVLGTYVVKEGFEPVVAKDGIEAFEMFKKCNPAVVLLDIMMPGMDGYKVCKKIRETSDVPIILITAKGEDYERVMGLDIGADDYVVKPFSPGLPGPCRTAPDREGRGVFWKKGTDHRGPHHKY